MNLVSGVLFAMRTSTCNSEHGRGTRKRGYRFPAPQDKGNVGSGDEIEWPLVVGQKFFLSSFEAFR